VAVELALEQHEEIADAIEARASTRARRAMTTHIGPVSGPSAS